MKKRLFIFLIFFSIKIDLLSESISIHKFQDFYNKKYETYLLFDADIDKIKDSCIKLSNDKKYNFENIFWQEDIWHLMNEKCFIQRNCLVVIKNDQKQLEGWALFEVIHNLDKFQLYLKKIVCLPYHAVNLIFSIFNFYDPLNSILNINISSKNNIQKLDFYKELGFREVEFTTWYKLIYDFQECLNNVAKLSQEISTELAKWDSSEKIVEKEIQKIKYKITIVNYILTRFLIFKSDDYIINHLKNLFNGDDIYEKHKNNEKKINLFYKNI
ncbi:hypothetical protein GF322_05210 [Candidatus Dependentiae bacterium]|nr:hypothetical protein [Candidatus Dependentiae bacterium]